MQGKLADLNLVVDKLSTDTSRDDVETETRELKSANERRKAALEQAFEERHQREAQIAHLEKEIQQVGVFFDAHPLVTYFLKLLNSTNYRKGKWLMD